MVQPSIPRSSKQVGRRIAEARRWAKVSQASLAAAVSLERSAISKIESGTRSLGSLELTRIARHLGRSLEWFVSEQVSAEHPAQTVQRNRNTILRIVRKHGGNSVRVFGSVARGDAGPESDIDLLVEMDPGSGLLAQAAMLLALERALGCDVDLVTPQGLTERIRERVLREAVPL